MTAREPSIRIDRFGTRFDLVNGTATSGYPAEDPLCVGCRHHADEHFLAGAEVPNDSRARFGCRVAGCRCRDFESSR